MKELKPCPFCGGKKIGRIDETPVKPDWLFCENCGVQTQEPNWNTRAETPIEAAAKAVAKCYREEVPNIVMEKQKAKFDALMFRLIVALKAAVEGK